MTGTLRGRRLDRGAALRVLPGDGTARARELQVHNASVDAAGPGRTAVNVAGIETEALSRGQVLTARSGDRRDGPDARAPSSATARTGRAPASIWGRRRSMRRSDGAAATPSTSRAADVGAILRLAEPVAAAPGDRFVLRRPSGAHQVVGGQVIDVAPARGVSRRRQTAERVAALTAAVVAGDAAAAAAARLELHGALVEADGVRLAPDVAMAASDAALARVGERAAGLADLRTATARALRRSVTLGWDDAVRAAGVRRGRAGP